jgi:hypothetical protein
VHDAAVAGDGACFHENAGLSCDGGFGNREIRSTERSLAAVSGTWHVAQRFSSAKCGVLCA